MSASWPFATQGKTSSPGECSSPRVCQNGPVHMSIQRAPLPTRMGSHRVGPAARGPLSFGRGPGDHREMIGEIALVGTGPITGLSSSCSRSSTVRTDAFTGSVQIQHESASCTADRNMNSTFRKPFNGPQQVSSYAREQVSSYAPAGDQTTTFDRRPNTEV